jgi:hypothetical protein
MLQTFRTSFKFRLSPSCRKSLQLQSGILSIITKASQDLHRYERIAEEHSVILRKDLDGLNRAHQEYAANSPPMGFLPPRDEFNRYIEESEKVLTKKCRTLLEHATCCKFNGVIMCQSTVFCSHVRGKRCLISLPGSTS